MSWSLVLRVEEEAAHCKAPATWAAAAPATAAVFVLLGCTMMFCDKPQEPKCLEYKKD